MNEQTQHWLKRAEWVSVSAAVVGTVASGVSQQAILATAPLSLSLVLNLANRRRADQLIHQHSERRIKQLHQDFLALNDLLANGVEAIRQQLLAMPSAPEQIDFTPVEEVIAAVKSELESRMMDLERADLSSVRQGVEQLQSELMQMREQIADLFEPDWHTSSSSSGFDPASMFELELGQATQLQSSTAIQADPALTLSDAEIGNLQQWQTQIEETTDVRTGMQGAFPGLSALEASAIQERLLQLQGAIAQLQLQGQRSAVVDLSPLQAQLEHLNQRLEQGVSATTAPTDFEQRFAQLESMIAQLAEAVKHPPANDDTALIFSAMRSLYERQNSMEQDFINTVRSEIQNALAGSVGVDAAPMRAEVNELRSAIVDLQSALAQPRQQVVGDVDGSSLHEQLEQGIAQVRLEVAQVEGKVRDVSVQLADLNALQQQVSVMQQQLRDGFAQLQATLTQLPMSSASATVDLSALQQQLNQIEQRLEGVSVATDATPLEQRLVALSETLDQWRTEAKANPNEDSDFIFSAMRSLYERQNSMEQEIINGVKTEVQKQLAPLIAIDSDAIQEGLSQLQVEVARLKHQLQVAPTVPAVDLTPIEAQIAQINGRLERVPPPFDPTPLERRMAQLQGTFDSWKDEVENSSLREDLKLFFAAMRGFSDRRNP
jgi:hypothetical protein